jgi:MarR family 2-MHQ and catechol resistance regulon transcriptional repressor
MSTKVDDRPAREWPQIRMLRALAIAHERFTEVHKSALRHFALSVSEFDVLAALGNTPGMRMKDIADHMMTSSSPSNVTRICTALEKRGLVERQRSPESDREVIARLTPKGDVIFQELFKQIPRFSAAFVDSALGEKEQLQVVKHLTRFIENAEEPPHPHVELDLAL